MYITAVYTVEGQAKQVLQLPHICQQQAKERKYCSGKVSSKADMSSPSQAVAWQAKQARTAVVKADTAAEKTFHCSSKTRHFCENGHCSSKTATAVVPAGSVCA